VAGNLARRSGPVAETFPERRVAPARTGRVKKPRLAPGLSERLDARGAGGASQSIVAMTRAMTDISLRRMLSEGPEVSLKGSPTVSPTTAALCGSEPL
jgi:hypothetical protein